MLKLYILYTVLGFYMLYYSLLYWSDPFDGELLQVDIALVASLVLFLLAPVICLYKPHSSPGFGLLCIALMSPFGFHWLQYRLMNPYIYLWDIENILAFVAVLWYMVTLIVTINTYTVRHHLKVKYYSRPVKLALSLLPLAIFLGITIYFAQQ